MSRSGLCNGSERELSAACHVVYEQSATDWGLVIGFCRMKVNGVFKWESVFAKEMTGGAWSLVWGCSKIYSYLVPFWEAGRMAKNTAISLSGHFAAFVEEQVSKGRYSNVSEVVRAGLRLLEEREAKLEALRTAITEGLASGPAEPFDVEAFIAVKER